jgi:O-antigen/teichoic acid export membrane protein
MVLSIVDVCGEHLDKILIRVFWNSAEVGYYYAAQRVVAFLMSISGTIQVLIFPTFSGLHAAGKIEELRSLTQRAEKYISFSLCPVLMILFVFGESIVRAFFGDQFLPALPMLYAMLIYVYFGSLNRPSASHILGVNAPLPYVILSLCQMVLGILFGLIFVPKSLFGMKMLGLGGYGAAILMAISGFVGMVATKVLVYKITRTAPYWRSAIHAAVAVLIGIVLYLLKENIPDLGFMQSAVLSGIGVALYFAALYLMREIRVEDLQYMRIAASPKKMREYVTSELKSGPNL